jgi:predicted RNase H-like HicB family nuclease
MKIVTVILGSDKGCYSAHFEELPSVSALGETVAKAKHEAIVALRRYIEISKKEGNTIPEFLNGDYEVEFEFEVPALLKYICRTVTQKAISQKTGIHETQITHYKTGLKKPRKAQREKIIEGIHAIGRDLLEIY